MVGDGGRNGGVIEGPVQGSLQIAHFLAGLGRQGKSLGVQASPATVNGQLGAIVYLSGERVVSTAALEIAEDQIVAIPRRRSSREVAACEDAGITGC
jgi:hypothetical protein